MSIFYLYISINSCTHFRIKKLEKYIYRRFLSILSLEYLDFAKYELYEMHDEIDANHFA